jgi:hypothetical protein
MKFYMPDFSESEVSAMAQKLRDENKRAIQLMTYLHEGARFEVTVGAPRKEYRKETGPRGGYKKNAGISRIGHSSGNPVYLITESARAIDVYSFRPDKWGHPSIVGENEVIRDTIEYFDL